MVNKLFY